MAYIKETQVLGSLIFGMFGFILAYYMRRGLNILLFGIFLYASLKGLEQLHIAPDWVNFYKFVLLFQQMGKTILTLINNMIATAGSISIFLFLVGGITGLTFSKRGV